MLAGHPGASHHLTAARPILAGNPIATAILDRAAALLDDDHERLLTTAAAFETAGCPYQRARTLILVGGGTAPAGNAALADLGLTPRSRYRLTSEPRGRPWQMQAPGGAAEMQLPGERVVPSSKTNGKPGGLTDRGLRLDQRKPKRDHETAWTQHGGKRLAAGLGGVSAHPPEC